MTEEQRLDAVMEVMNSAFDPYWREAWTRSQVATSLALPHTRAILISAEGHGDVKNVGDTAGFVLARRAPGEEELLLIAVKPEHRQRGLGGRLLREFVSSAKKLGADKVFLEMRDGNPAENLYRSEGFTPIGRRREYYRAINGEKLDALTFTKSLIDGS